MAYLTTLFALLFLSNPSTAQDPITINKGELVDITFNSRLTAADLEDIKKRLAELDITIEYTQTKFNKKGKLKGLKIEVDCNDGFSGSAWSPNITKRLHVYFYRDYTTKKSPFGTGVSIKKNDHRK